MVHHTLRRVLHLPAQTEWMKRWLIIDLLGALAGIAGGLGAIVFRMMIAVNRKLFFGLILGKVSLQVLNVNLGYTILPILGGLVAGPLIMKFAPETKGHGVPEVMEAVAFKGGRIRKRVVFLKILVSSVTIGSGGSAGREGPIAQIGASIGSALGDLFKLDSRDVRLLVVCGLSAGIAGTFNAPMGGMLFGLEVLYRGVGLFDAVPVALASVIGAAIVSAYYGPKPSFIAPPTLTFTNPSELIWYFVLGALMGLTAIVWVKIFYVVEDFFTNLRVNSSYKLALGGAVTGLIGMFFPEHGIMGVGYEGINMVLAGKLGLYLLVALGLLKMIATACTIGSGGSGGVFAPSLYIGTMLGGAMGLLFQMVSPSVVRSPFTYSLAGMAALFAGAAQAPLSVMIMIPEMSNDYSLLPPLMVSSVTSFIVARVFLKGSSIYTLKLERRGIRLRMGRSFILEEVKVGEIMTTNVVSVHEDATLSELELLIAKTHHHGFPVVEDGRLVGIVTFGDLIRIPAELRRGVKVGDIMHKEVVVAYPDESVQMVLDRMLERRVGRVPVVSRSDPTKLLGIMTHSDVMKAYEVAASERI